MRQRFRRLATAGLLAATVLAGSGISAGAASEPATLASGINAASDGQSVVWAAPGDDQNQQHDIYRERTTGGARQLVAGGPHDQTMPAVSGSTVVWAENVGAGVSVQRDVLGVDLAGGAPFAIAATAADEHDPAIWEHYVIWVSTDVDSQTNGLVDTLLLKDLNTTDQPVVLAQSPSELATSGILRPVINAGRIVWLSALKSSMHSSAWKLMTAGIDNLAPLEIDSGFFAIGGPSATLAPLDQPGFDVAAGVLVYSTNFNVYAVDLMTQTKKQLASGDPASWQPGGNPTTNGRYVYWQDYSYTADASDLALRLHRAGFRADIAGYDLLSDSAFPVTTATGYNTHPIARAGTVLFERRADLGDAVAQIQVMSLAATLPTAPRPNPGKTSPDWFYFTETQHYLSFGFKDFWVQSGGLPVFGFPLTEEFSERNADLGRMLTVQYLERQRYEYHPEHAGTPYEVELGRLGAEDAAARGMLPTPPFQPVGAGTAGTGCEFFAATGHAVCANFLTYWHDHGLAFGDPGFSYRESLALFGYPISEPFTDPSSGLTVQYFERARFEWHPENPEPYKVLLGRLAADRLYQRGW